MTTEPCEPIDPIAAAQAAALTGAKGAKVHPIRPELADREEVRCVTAQDFLADLAPPEWVVEGIVQRGYLTAITAPTNHGKTAVSLLMSMCVASGTEFAGLPVAQGKVLILCGENQDGFKLRMLATLKLLALEPKDIAGACWVYPQAGGLLGILDTLKKDAETIGDLALVLVDTSVSFFDGADENDNVSALTHALALRALTRLPGSPAVIANCHPTGSAAKENCVPRGGSAFLNEIDTNLCVWADGETSELHWVRKKRGPDFDPLWFEYVGVTLEAYGNKVPTVVARPITEERDQKIKGRKREEENRVLYEMHRNATWSFSEMALACGFKTTTGAAHKSKVARVLDRLKEVKLVAHDRRKGWHLTSAGKDEAGRIS